MKYAIIILILVLSTIAFGTQYVTELTVPQTRYLSVENSSINSSTAQVETEIKVLVENNAYEFTLDRFTNSQIILNANPGGKVTLWIGDSHVFNTTSPGVRVTLTSIGAESAELYLEKKEKEIVPKTVTKPSGKNNTNLTAKVNGTKNISITNQTSPITEISVFPQQIIHSVYAIAIIFSAILIITSVYFTIRTPKEEALAPEPKTEVKTSTKISSFNEYEELKKELDTK